MDITESLRLAIVAVLASPEEVIGTGFFVTSNGYILTCYHVIEPLLITGKSEIMIRTKEGAEIPTVYEKDKSRPENHIDFAVLKTHDEGPFPCLPLGRDFKIRDGWCSRGFSYPKNYNNLPNRGAIDSEASRNNDGGYDIKLSTETPVRGGASGSPLLNERTGLVIGIIKSRPTKEGWKEGFAVPVEDVLAKWPDLEKKNSESWTLIKIELPRRLVNVPQLPPNFLERPEDLEAVKEALQADSSQSTAITGTLSRVGLHGMGGIGKSVLAIAVAREKRFNVASTTEYFG